STRPAKSIMRRRLPLARELRFEPVEDCALRREDHAPCRIEVEPGCLVDFRKFLRPARPRRPLYGERAAGDPRDIQVSGSRPRVDDLATGLPDWPERQYLAFGQRHAEPLLELPACDI